MENLTTLNQHRWDKCKVNSDKVAAFKSVAARLSAPTAVAHYKAVEQKTGVPWWFIAVVHERESSQRWDRSLAQGDPWNKKSVHVPANRGPFNSWEDAAYDALVNCPPYAARNKDWSIGGALTMLEKYNGLGYYRKGVPSPYIWAGTNQYTRGKYTSDGVYSATAVDSQLGVAGLLKTMNVFGSSTVAATGGAAGAVAAGGVAIATSPPRYWPWIIGGTVAAVVVIGLGILIYNFKHREQ